MAKRKRLAAFRLRDDVQKILTRLALRTQKTKTRLIEEAILLHANDLGK